MTARGGGWTRLYVSPATSLYSTTRDYDVTTQALRSTEVAVMMALDEAGTLDALEREWLNQGGGIPTLSAD